MYHQDVVFGQQLRAYEQLKPNLRESLMSGILVQHLKISLCLTLLFKLCTCNSFHMEALTSLQNILPPFLLPGLNYI